MILAFIGAALFVFLMVYALKSGEGIDKAQKQVDEVVQRTVGHDRYLNEHGVVIRREYTDGNNRFIIDEVHRAAHIASYGTPFRELPFSKVRGCEVTTAETKYESKKIGAVPRAVVGGAVAGGSGAVVGAMTAKNQMTAKPGTYLITIYLSDIDLPQITLRTTSRDFASTVKAAVGVIVLMTR